MDSSPQDSRTDAEKFERSANHQASGMFKEFLQFLRHNKKWWLLPIILVLLLLGVLVILGGTAAGPFIYTLF